MSRLLMALAFCFCCGTIAFSLQDPDTTKISFHVTAVRSEQPSDWCQTGECTAIKYIVEGYVENASSGNITEYVTNCVEVLVQKPSPHYSIVCVKVHAGNEYLAKLGSSYIAFETDHDNHSANPIVGAYEITSEREVVKKKPKDKK